MVPQMGLALDVSGVARVIDGDTLDIERLGIRLHGIDTPETGQACSRADGSSWACGKAARDRLVALADRKRVRCTGSKWEPRRRLIAVCHVGDTELQGVLIREGLAWAFVRYSQDYVAREAEARTAKRGIWAGTAQPPWEYRAQRWTAGNSVAPANCPIKGNINAKGRRLYFVPWHRAYAHSPVRQIQRRHSTGVPSMAVAIRSTARTSAPAASPNSRASSSVLHQGRTPAWGQRQP
jgi:endonuclease YncB( thermonuclease family)